MCITPRRFVSTTRRHALGVAVVDRAVAADAGVRDREVDRAEPVDARGREGLDARPVPDVGHLGRDLAPRLLDPGGDLRQAALVEVGEHDPGALGREEGRAPLADAPARAGHDPRGARQPPVASSRISIPRPR